MHLLISPTLDPLLSSALAGEVLEENTDLGIFHLKMVNQGSLFKTSDLEEYERKALESSADEVSISCAFAAAYAAKVFDKVLSKNPDAPTATVLDGFSAKLLATDNAKKYIKEISSHVTKAELKTAGTTKDLSYDPSKDLPFALKAFPNAMQLARGFLKTKGQLKTDSHVICDIGANAEPHTKTQHHVEADNRLASDQLINPEMPYRDNRIASLVKAVMEGKKPYSVFILPERFPGGHFIAVAIRKNHGKLETFVADGLNATTQNLTLKKSANSKGPNITSPVEVDRLIFDRPDMHPIAMIQRFARPEVTLGERPPLTQANFSRETYQNKDAPADLGGVPIPIPCDSGALLPSMPYEAIQKSISKGSGPQLSRVSGERLEGSNSIRKNGQIVHVNTQAGKIFEEWMNDRMFGMQESFDEIGSEGITKILAVASASGRDPQKYFEEYLKPALTHLFGGGDSEDSKKLSALKLDLETIQADAAKLKKACQNNSKEKEFREESYGECHLASLAEGIKENYKGKPLTADGVITHMQKNMVSVHSMSGTSGCSSIAQLATQLHKINAISDKEEKRLKKFTTLLNSIQGDFAPLYHEYLDNLMWLGVDLKQTLRLIRKLQADDDGKKLTFLQGLLETLRKDKKEVSASEPDLSNRERVHKLTEQTLKK